MRLIDGKSAPRAAAAFANAVLLSGRVQGDSHPCGHLGGVVIPATLAAAEHARASGAQYLSALIASYEISLRIGRDHAADLSTRGFRTTPCYGVFGASAGAGKLMGFDGDRIANAIRLAANFAGGLREYVDAATEESPFQAGFAARNGLHVADLISCGITAAPSALHGSNGFYRAFAEPGFDYGKRLVEDLGRHFEFTTVTFKQYPACQWLRGPIRGMAMLSKEARGARPRHIELTMNSFEADFVGVRYTGPFTSATQTVMSAPFCAALGWTEGTASYAGLRDFANTAVLDLIPKIRVISDASRRRYEPHLRVVTESGAVLEWEDTAGQDSYRISWDAAVMMTRQLTEEVGVPAALADALIERVEQVERASSVQPIIDAVCAATSQAKGASASAATESRLTPAVNA
jgi:2-methylcitrate dehydratase PrpD